MFENKIINLLLLGIILFFVYRFATRNNRKKESKNINVKENFDIKYNNLQNHKVIKPILKKYKGVNHNRRVRFSLPEPIRFNEKNIDEYYQDQKNSTEHQEEEANSITTDLCQNKHVDLSESFPEKWDKIKNCNKMENNNVSLRDIYDDIVIDYKKSQPMKDIMPVINTRKDAGFGLSSYDNSHWNYQNENVINGGNIDDNLYANDPFTDQIARF
jgi:hypothetical protein